MDNKKYLVRYTGDVDDCTNLKLDENIKLVPIDEMQDKPLVRFHFFVAYGNSEEETISHLIGIKKLGGVEVCTVHGIVLGDDTSVLSAQVATLAITEMTSRFYPEDTSVIVNESNLTTFIYKTGVLQPSATAVDVLAIPVVIIVDSRVVRLKARFEEGVISTLTFEADKETLLNILQNPQQTLSIQTANLEQ